MTQDRALKITAAIVLIWAIVAGVQYLRTAPQRSADRCASIVARQIADDQYRAGVAQPWETVETITRPAGAGYFVRISVRAYPAQGDPYTVNYVCTVPGPYEATRIGDWIE